MDKSKADISWGEPGQRHEAGKLLGCSVGCR
jgi:hypothetical protein